MADRFADAGYWIALWNPNDNLHERARLLGESLAGEPIVTTLPVLVEAVDHFARLGPFSRALAAHAAWALTDNQDLDVIPMTQELFDAALQRYANRPDQRWSLTDCASFLVMEERGITEALAYDRDFEQAGFSALLREGSS